MKHITIPCIVLALVLTSAVWAQHRLEDEQIRFEIDDAGRVIHLENKTSGSGNVIRTPTDGLYRMICKKGENWEAVVFPDRQQCKVTKDADTIRIVVDKIKTYDTPNELTLTMTVKLDKGTLRFGAEIDNRQKDLTVVEFRYPRLGVVKSLGGDRSIDLLFPLQTGRRYKNFGTGASVSHPYPGMSSMQWMALTDDRETLYFSGRDGEIYTSSLHADGVAGGGAALALTRFAFVGPDTTWTSPETIIRLYTGTWHAAADEYRAWASAWRKVRPRPDWVRDMIGYFLVINKQQYGDEMWPYETLPKLYELAVQHGFDTLGLFGWYQGGHDNTYPDIEVGRTLGGREKLIENIKKVREAGGNVTLYVQGHLIDPTSEFYQKHGRDVEAHSHWGTPYYEHYNKSSHSEFLQRYTAKCFSTACPTSELWQDRMVKNVDFIVGFGASGVLFDQIGGMPPRPCFNPKHRHRNGNPGLAYAPGRFELLEKIHDRAREIGGKDFAFFTEHVTDAYSPYADMLHGITEAPSPSSFPEMFRYCFPETVITVRNPAPHISSAFTNFAATYGFVMEMEIRYRNDVEHVLADVSAPQRRYAKQVAALRREYRDVLARGVFVDEIPLENGNPEMICKAFQSGNRLGVVLWNPTGKAQSPKLDVPGYKLAVAAAPESAERFKKLPETIPASRVVIAVYEK